MELLEIMVLLALVVMPVKMALKAQSDLQDPREHPEREVLQVLQDLAVSKVFQALLVTPEQLERTARLVFKELVVCRELQE